MICGVSHGVGVGENSVFYFESIVVGECVFYFHSEITGEAVLTVRRKACECDATVSRFFNLPWSEAETAASVQSPCALVVGGMILLAVECEFCVSYSVCPPADNEALIPVVWISVVLWVVESEDNICELSLLVGYAERLYACA